MGRKNKRKKNPLRGLLKSIFDMGLFLLIVLVITYFLSNYVVERLIIHNHSMENTIMPEDNILIDKISYRFRNPQRYDIIVFKQNGTGEKLIKRIFALPHETIQIKDKVIYIDGEPIEDVSGLEEIDYAGLAQYPVTLGEGEYFVIGDNRSESIDSRYEEVGIVTDTRIIGRAFMRILPVKNIRFF